MAEELLVFVFELGAKVVQHTPGHGALHDGRHRPGVADRLVVADTLFLRDLVVELGRGEGFPAPFSFNVGGISGGSWAARLEVNEDLSGEPINMTDRNRGKRLLPSN